MDKYTAVTTILLRKIKRQTALKEKSKQLEDVDFNILSKRIGRFFGSSYLMLKRIIASTIGLVLIGAALILLFYPEILFQDKKTNELIIKDAKEHYAKIAGVTLEKAIEEIIESKEANSLDNFMSHLNNAIEKALLQDAIENTRYLALPLLLMAFFLFYVNRMTRKMYERNRKISEAENTTKEVINDYINSIDLEEEELVEIQKLIQNMNNVKSHY